MKRKNLKTMAAVLSTVMLASASLAGCGGETAPASSSAAASSTQSSTAQSSAAADSTGGETASSLVSENPIELTIMMSDNANQPLKNDAPAHEEIFKRTNVDIKIEIVPNASYEEKKSIVLGTNNFPDMIYIGTGDLVTYGTEGIFEPLMQYVNEETMPNFYKFWQEYPNMKNYLIDGELYAFPVVARNEAANGYGPVIRTDLLEKHDIPLPTTWEELLDALTKLKELYPDSTPWTGRKGTIRLFESTAYMLGSGYGMYFDFDENKYIFGQANPNFKLVLDYLNRAYEAGVLDPEYQTTTAQTLEANMCSGESFFFCDNSGFGQNYTNTLQKVEGCENAELQILKIPANSFGKSRAITYETILPGRLYALNAKAENKEEIIKFIDWMYSQEGSDISNYGVEGVSFEYDENGEPQFIEEYVMQFKDAQPAGYYGVYSDLGITKLDWSLWACNTETQFKLQKIHGTWGELVDEYWEIVNNDEAYHAPMMTPSFTAEESERIQDILVEMNTMLEQEYDKYIMGKTEISEWDNIIKKCEEMGVRELEQIYNDAYARVQAQ